MTAPLPPTPGQTVGPFYGYALPWPDGERLVPPGRADAVALVGNVYDGAGEPVPDALLELWQADAAGSVVRRTGSLHRDGHTFTGFGRAATDDEGRYVFTTVRPGAVDGSAPFFALTVFARGLLNRLFTRVYLADVQDSLLSRLDPQRRATLLARDEGDVLAFDVHLQGPRQTVFLEFAP